MRDNNNSNSCLDFIFKTPETLEFSRLYRYYFDMILRLLYRILLFEGIPETVSETFFKMTLFTQGKSCFLKGNVIDEGDQLIALNCTRADTPGVYYIPRKVLVTNPRLRKSYNLMPGEDCELVYMSEPDKYVLSEFGGGLYELIRRTAVMLADNDISINIAQKNTRLVNLVSGDTQNTVDSIRAVIASMYEGKPTIVVKSSLIDKLQGVPILEKSSQQNLVELIEVQQYILSHFYESIGICTHDQMKRERLITAEINDNLDLALFNIDDMIVTIQEGLDRVNTMFGTSITCRLNPIIERQREEGAAADAAPSDFQEEEAQSEPEPEPEAAAEPGPGLDRETIRKASALIVSRILAKAEQPEEDPEEEAQSEPEPEPEAAAEPDPEEDPEEEAQSEPEPEPEAAAEIQESDVKIEISGDNNKIIIGGEANADAETDDPPDVGEDSLGE